MIRRDATQGFESLVIRRDATQGFGVWGLEPTLDSCARELDELAREGVGG